VRTFGLAAGPFDAFTIWGMIWSQGLSLVPVAYLLISATFGTMDPSLEDAARISGASVKKTMVRVTFPLLTPAIASTGALLFMLNIHSFETPIFLGLPGRVQVYMNAIYESLTKIQPPNWGLGTAQSFVFLLLSAGAMGVYLRLTRRLRSYTVITGKAYRPRVIGLGRWRYLTLSVALGYVLVAIGMPLVTIFLISLVPFYSATLPNPFANLTLQNYASALRAPVVLGSAYTSLQLAILVAILSIMLGSVLAFIIVKSRVQGKRMLEVLSALPLAYPSLVFGVALFWMFLSVPGIRLLWGSIWVLVVGYIAIFMPFTIRTLTNSMVQIHSELEEVARTSGATWLTGFRRVTLPILRPALVNAAVFVFIASSLIHNPRS
jgi:iron(III) transport system permease protein